DGFTREFADEVAKSPPVKMGRVWVLQYRPEEFRDAATRLIEAEPKLAAQWNTPLTDVKMEGGRIASINGIHADAVVDCSGTAEVAGAVKADCLETNESTQASSVLVALSNVTRQCDSPASVAQALLPLARAGLPVLSFQANLDPGTITAKFTG